MTDAAEVMILPSGLSGRLAFSPDGTLLAVGTAVIDVAGWRVLRVLRGHLAPATVAAFSPDGALVATAAFDGTARVHDVVTGATRIAINVGADEWANDIAFSPDGMVLATGGEGGIARIWDARTGRPL